MLPLWKAWPDLTVDWLEMARRPMRPMRLVRSAWVGGDASAAFPGIVDGNSCHISCLSDWCRNSRQQQRTFRRSLVFDMNFTDTAGNSGTASAAVT